MNNISNEEFARIIYGTKPKEHNARVSEEHEIQKACVKWFRLQYRSLSSVLFAIPNGAYKSKAAAGMMKAEGLTAGVADLCLAVPRGRYGALYIEMKQRGNYQQKNQKEWQIECERAGNKYVVCKSIQDFMREVNEYMRLGTPLSDIKSAYENYATGHMSGQVFLECIKKALSKCS